MIVAFTGHRPPKLGGYDPKNFALLTRFAERVLDEYLLPTDTVISGMALGWDMAVAAAADNMNREFIAAIPFKGQDNLWNAVDKNRYAALLHCRNCVLVEWKAGQPCTSVANAMDNRNHWMVDRANMVISLWDGSSGGTANCVRYAERSRREVVNVWTRWSAYRRHSERRDR